MTSPFADRTVFVLGPVRSGTTWLLELLLGHPALAGLPWESTVFMGLWDMWENAHRVDGQGISALLDDGELAATLRVFCDSIFSMGGDEGGADTNKRWFLEKTPDNVNRLPLMRTAYPDAWYIHLIRDGRDVVRSQLRAPWGTDDPAEAARNWVLGVRQVRSHGPSLERFTELRYEDLCADPVARTVEVLGWLGLDVGDEVVHELKERSSHQMARYGATDPVGPGKWVDLSPSQLQAVYDVAGDLLAELGYLAQE